MISISYLHLAQLTIETVLYHHLRYIMIFFKKQRIMIFWDDWYKRTADKKFYMHTYLTLNLFMLFNITWTSSVCEIYGTKMRYLSIFFSI